MAQPTVDTTPPTDSGGDQGHGAGRAARVAGAAAMAAVTGAIRGRIHATAVPPARPPVEPTVEPARSPVEPAVEPACSSASPPPTPDERVAQGTVVEPDALSPVHDGFSIVPERLPAGPEEMDATLVLHHGRWTAQRALAELPETPAAAIEVIDGSLVVSPRHGIRHQTVVLEFGIALKRAARMAGYGTHPQVKVIVGDELVCPDLTVATRLGEDTSCVGAHEVLLVAEVVLADHGRTRRLDRTPVYAAGKIGHYLRLDFRGHDPVIALHELVDGQYQPVAVASVGARFTTSRPFDFAIDPVELRGRQMQPRVA